MTVNLDISACYFRATLSRSSH